jgi:hypothetical protein
MDPDTLKWGQQFITQGCEVDEREALASCVTAVAPIALGKVRAIFGLEAAKQAWHTPRAGNEATQANPAVAARFGTGAWALFLGGAPPPS